jgi:hypothetical protein
LYVPVEALDATRVMRLPKAAAAWSAPERGHWLKLIGAGLRGEDRALAA